MNDLVWLQSLGQICGDVARGSNVNLKRCHPETPICGDRVESATRRCVPIANHAAGSPAAGTFPPKWNSTARNKLLVLPRKDKRMGAEYSFGWLGVPIPIIILILLFWR
jgi:hypothetical protein